MNLRQKLNYRIPACLCVLLFLGAGLIAYSTFKLMRQIEKVEQLPDVAHENELEEDEGSKSRGQGLLFRRLQLQDENGKIDPNGLRKAREQITKMKKVQAQRKQKRTNQIQEAAVTPQSWTWLGPGNIGGRIRSISINPDNADDILIGSVSGGIWRTLNGGVSWFPVNDFMANLAVTTIARSPTDPNIIYAGTGEGFAGDGIQGAGIFRSTDGGIIWTQLLFTNIAAFNTVNRIAISPNGATLLAATGTGIWRSTDAGITWSQRTFNQVEDIDFHPTDSNRAVAGENANIVNVVSKGLLSTNAGESWNTTVNFTPTLSVGVRIELAYAPSGGFIVYASVARSSGVAPNVSEGEIYRSTDGGQNYTQVNVGNNLLGGQGSYDNMLWVNPQDPDFVIVGGVLPYRSFDGGTTFAAIGDSPTNLPHADHHIAVSHPGFNNNTNKTVFFGNDGGIQRMADVSIDSPATAGWTELNNNLGITQFYGAAGNPVSGRIVGGTQDNGTLRYTGGTELWTRTAGADGGFVAADQTDANYFYGEQQNLAVFRSSNGGETSTRITSGLGDFTGTACTACQTNFIAPIALDPNEPNRLLAGGWSLWRTNDARNTAAWTSIKNQTNVPIPPTGTNPRPISAITISPINSDWVIVGHNNGDIFQTFFATSDNPTPNWTKIDTAGLPNRFVTRLAIDTTRSPNWIYATFGGFSADNIYVSKNLGTSWTDITGTGATGLPDVPVRTLVIHPSNSNLLYVGTEVGIFTSSDAGATWDLPNGGPANVSVDELFWMGGDLVAATHGRGMYRASGGFYVDCNYNGVQTGSFDQPFKTVNAAINALTSYRPIWLKPCTYTEQINTANYPTKKFEIRSLGGTATVNAP